MSAKGTHWTSIDWQWLVDCYNKDYKTTFKDEKSLLMGLLKDFSPQKIADVLGVSYTTIYKRLDFHNIERSHTRGGYNNKTTPLLDRFYEISEEKMKRMTAREISINLGSSVDTVYKLLRTSKRLSKKLRS